MIWLVGAKGMLGSRLALTLEKNSLPFIATDIEVDITNPEALHSFAATHPGIAYIINCSAYTNVDKAESDREKAFAINQTGVQHLAETAAGLDIPFIHLSTDYVFDGTASSPYREETPPNPVSVYGSSKLAGELAALAACKKTIIIRTAWLYDAHGKNFLLTMLRLFREKGEAQVVADQSGSPTWAADLALAIIQILRNLKTGPKPALYGIFHFSNEGITTWHKFATEIARQAHQTGLLESLPAVHPVSSHAWPTPVQRPAWSVLDKGKIQRIHGVEVPSWQDALKKCMAEV
jgi:dTDP-4-dehydrorhamnose reductase